MSKTCSDWAEKSVGTTLFSRTIRVGLLLDVFIGTQPLTSGK
jgi:hypothetical protein